MASGIINSAGFLGGPILTEDADEDADEDDDECDDFGDDEADEAEEDEPLLLASNP
jgi:hypothetical protein